MTTGTGLLHNTNGFLDPTAFLGAAGQIPVVKADGTDTVWVSLSGGATMTAAGVVTIAALGASSGGGNIDTDQSTTSATLVDLATVGPSVTLTTGTSALVIFQALHMCTSTSNGTASLGVAVSGATTIAASSNFVFQGLDASTSKWRCLSAVRKITGLTPGANTFTLKYAGDNGLTHHFSNRGIAAFAL